MVAVTAILPQLKKVFYFFLLNNYFFCLTNAKTKLLNYFDPFKGKKQFGFVFTSNSMQNLLKPSRRKPLI